MLIRALSAIAILLAASLAGGGASAQELRFFRIATGSAAGTYFPVGSAIAAAISSPPGSPTCERGGSCGVLGLVAVATTSEGSIANVAAIAGGLVDSGLAQADIIEWAFTGQGPFARRPKLDKLRVIANLYPESLHLVVRRGAGITKIQDLAGKRVSLDKPGSGTRTNAEVILSAYGLRVNQLKVVESDPSESVDLLQDGELDAFVLIAGYPASAVAELAQLGLIDLVPITGRPAKQALRRHRFFAADHIPAGTYEGITGTDTVSIGAQWVASELASEDLIYEITKALWNPKNRRLLEAGHAKGQQIRISTALSGVSIPLHAGAERYYRELGLFDRRPADDITPE